MKKRKQIKDKISTHTFCDKCIINAERLAYLAKEEGRKQTLEEVEKIIDDLNDHFRKNNTPQRLTGDEFNDRWQKELKSKIKQELEK